MITFSILDLSPIIEGATASDALHNSLDLAQHAETWNYKRYWVAEHHNMPGIASAATAVVIGYIAGGTKNIRVGSGGIMLPNHSPLIIAEQFGTLESIYPGRIDLGLGRAPGTDQRTSVALRRDASASDNFPRDVLELQSYFRGKDKLAIQAVPGSGLNIPVWLLGSSLFSAQLAGMLGLPYAFAAHFAPQMMEEAIEIYRREFVPSEHYDKPYLMICLNVFTADTDNEAKFVFTSIQQQFLRLRSGMPDKTPPPVRNMEIYWNPAEKRMVDSALRRSIVGSSKTVKHELNEFINEFKPDELMITAQIYDHTARLKSFELTSEIRDSLN